MEISEGLFSPFTPYQEGKLLKITFIFLIIGAMGSKERRNVLTRISLTLRPPSVEIFRT